MKKFDGNLWKWLLNNVMPRLLPRTNYAQDGNVLKVWKDEQTGESGAYWGEIETPTLSSEKMEIPTMVFSSLSANMEAGVAKSISENELSTLNNYLKAYNPDGDFGDALILISCGTVTQIPHFVANINTLRGFGRNFPIYRLLNDGTLQKACTISWTYTEDYRDIASFSVTPEQVDTGTYNWEFSISFLGKEQAFQPA